MNVQEAQLREDYGKYAVGNIAGHQVVAPEDGIFANNTYILKVDENGKDIALKNTIEGTTVTLATATGSVYDTAVSSMQENIVVANGKITGKLKKLTSGPLPDYWGPGYFLAIQFSNITDAMSSVKVGLIPSMGSGLVEITTDVEKIAVFNITNKNNQVVATEITTSDGTITNTYDISELVLE